MDESAPLPARLNRAPAGRRRYVTVLFSDVSGSSEHAEQLEAEEYAELLEQFRDFARDIVPRHGGSIARLQGDGLLALFGHIETREDDGRRATEAALELHTAVSRLQAGRGAHATALQMHSGVHAGLLLLLEGDIERGRFDVVGEVVNTAARLCSLAGAGEIYASDESLGPQAHFFAMTRLGRVPIRGRRDELSALRIEGQARAGRRIDAAARRGRVGLVGRSDVLAALHAAAADVRAGLPACVVICGEAGIGKTRVVEEFLHGLHEHDFSVLRGYCENYLGAEPLQPFLQWLRRWAENTPGLGAGEPLAAVALSALDAETEARVGPALLSMLGLAGAAAAPGAAAKAAPPGAAAQQGALLAVLETLSRQRPVLLVLDDWQWADDASRQVLQALRARGLPLLLLVATRPVAEEDPALAGAPVLQLPPLGGQEAQRAVAAWLPDADPLMAQEIVAQAGGSPLFIEELCHAAAQGRPLRESAHGTGVAWINALVASRSEGLAPLHAECLRVAAVAGSVVPLWLLERLLGSEHAPAVLQALRDADFLVPDAQPATLRFKHVLTRDAIYATVNLERRRALHLRVARALEEAAADAERAPGLEALAYHFDAAGLSEPAARYAELAGDKALAAMALDRARALYTTALRALDALPALDTAHKQRWCTIAQRLGQTCVFDALDVGHGLVLFNRAAALARETGQANAVARAEYWLGYVNYGKGQPKLAVQHCEEALRQALASDDQRLAAQVRATLGQSLASAGRYAQALPLLAEAVQSKRRSARPGSGTAIGSAYTLARTGYTLGDLGRFDEAWGCFDEALQLLGSELHAVKASVLELMCVVYLWQGRWAEAHAAGVQGTEIALQCRSRFNTAMGRALAACAAWAESGSHEALQTLRDATRWIEANGGAVSTSLNYGWLVEATLSQGLYTEARQHAARLRLRARAQDRHGEAQGCRALARHAMANGQLRMAAHWWAAAEQAAAFRQSPREQAMNLLARAESAAAGGVADEARALAAQAAAAFEAMQMRWHAARAAALA